MRTVRSIATTALVATLSVVALGCSSESDTSSTTTAAPQTTEALNAPDPSTAGGLTEPTGEPVSFCEPLDAVMSIFNNGGGDRSEAEALVGSLDELAAASATESEEVSASAALLATEVRKVLALEGDFNENMSAAANANTAIADAAVTLSAVSAESCGAAEEPSGANNAPVPE